MSNFKATVTRNSNGSVELVALGTSTIPKDVEMGSEVDVSVTAIRSAAEIQGEADAKAQARGVPAPAAPVAPSASVRRVPAPPRGRADLDE